jgi:aminoglycoside phosphotransferase (APT) family kinase protein
VGVAPEELQLTRRDWRWQATLPGERMLHIPVDALGARRLAGERRLLRALAPRVSFAVPDPLGPLDGPLDLRRRVAGDTGMRLHWSTLEDPARAERYAEDLARVLAELHGAFAPAELRAVAPPPDVVEYPRPVPGLRAVVASLPADIHARLHAALDRYATLDPDGPEPVLVHGDLGTHNLAFDPETRRVVGLFDFEGATAHDRHHDFKYLPSFGPRVMRRVLDGYRARSGATIDVGRVRLVHLATALSFWAWREADPDGHDARSGRDRDQALAWVGHALFSLPLP